MQREEKHTLPRFISLPLTIFLWTLLVLFLVVGLLVWSEQVPTYATTQGIVVVQSATQPSAKVAPVPGTKIPATANGESAPTVGKQVSGTKKPIPSTAVGI